MPAINWSTTLADIDTQLGSASGVDLAIGQGIREKLYRIGTHYDVHFTPTVDTAKSAWIAAATLAHNQADEACRYVEDLIGDPGPALMFDALSRVAIRARCNKAASAATTPTLKSSIERYTAEVNRAYSDTRGLYAAPEYISGQKPDYTPFIIKSDDSVREIEIALTAQIDAAAEWIALVQYT